MKKIRNHLTILGTEKIYKAMILPRLDYCDIVLNNNMAPYLEESFEKLQQRAAKLVLKNDARDGLIRQLGWSPLSIRRKIHATTFNLKCLMGTVPQFLKNYYSISNHVYSTRGNGYNLTVPMVKTETLKKSMFYYGTKLFNNLPKDIKEVNSLLIFKSKLRDFYRS